MLAVMYAICLASIVSFFIANKLHYSYANGIRTLSASLFDAVGVILGIGFSMLMFYNETNFYTVPRIMAFVSVCVYVRCKKRKRFCTPFWKMMRNTAFVYSTLGMVGKTLEIVQLMSDSGYGTVIKIITIVCCIVVSGLLVSLTGAFFECLLNRRRRLSYYY
ncbi:MAG: hypothetical protein HFJ50_02725 [Clostridia bacterium]|jgi:hypothetical protein|nr:hypothetical protein [Clostridia bacterium]